MRLIARYSWHHVGMEEESIQRSLKNLGVDYVDLVSEHRIIIRLFRLPGRRSGSCIGR